MYKFNTRSIICLFIYVLPLLVYAQKETISSKKSKLGDSKGIVVTMGDEYIFMPLKRLAWLYLKDKSKAIFETHDRPRLEKKGIQCEFFGQRDIQCLFPKGTVANFDNFSFKSIVKDIRPFYLVTPASGNKIYSLFILSKDPISVRFNYSKKSVSEVLKKARSFIKQSKLLKDNKVVLKPSNTSDKYQIIIHPNDKDKPSFALADKVLKVYEDLRQKSWVEKAELEFGVIDHGDPKEKDRFIKEIAEK